MSVLDQLSQAELTCGYHLRDDCFRCNFCEVSFSDKEVYAVGGHFYRAQAAIEIHLRDAHGSNFQKLLEYNQHSLTEKQTQLFRFISQGKSDAEIAKLMGVAPATVRSQRFTLRERAKQAKLFLALYANAQTESVQPQDDIVEIHEGATMLDDRYVVTKEEEEKIRKTCFSSLDPMKLEIFSHKEKKKIVVLRQIMTAFDASKHYTEKEVNAILKEIYFDYVTIRRYLIEYGFMQRTDNGSDYWVV